MKNKSSMRPAVLATAIVGLVFGGQAIAAGIATSPDPASVSIGSSTVVAVEFTGDGQTTAFTGALEYDTVVFDAVSDNANCQVNDAFSPTTGRVALAVVTLTPLASQTFCNVTFTETTNMPATTAGSPYALPWFNPVFGGSAGGDTVDDGAINVIEGEPDVVLSYAPPAGSTIAFAGGTSGDTVSESIAVSVSGSIGTAEVSSCSLGGANPGAFSIAGTSFPVGDGGTIDIDCTLANSASTATLDCTASDSTGASSPSWNLSCPAGDPVPAPEYSSTPAPGPNALTCNGAAGSTQTTSIEIENTGFAGLGSELDYTCSVTSGAANFAITGGTAGSVPVGSTATVSIECTVPLAPPAATGEITCTSNDAANSPAVYGISSAIVTAPPPVPQPALIPAGSLWSKLALFGLLAGLGALVIGMRRH